MRVLHVLRRDHGVHTGGDLVQLEALSKGLRDLGLDVVASSSVDGAGRAPDVIHLYNLDRTAEVAEAIAAGRQHWPDARIVMSPVFWPAPLRDIATSYGRHVRARALKYVLKEVRWWQRQRAILTDADAVCPSSEAEGIRMERWFRMPRDERWVTVPNGIWLDDWRWRHSAERTSVLTELGLDPGLDCLVACAARIEARKNQLALVEAVHRLPGTALALIGPLSEAGYARKVAAAARAIGRVVLTGPRSQKELARIFGGVDVHVLPSLQEIPGLATLEAAAVGCEVVYTPGGSTSDYVGDLGHKARSTRPSDLADAITAAVRAPRQPALRQRVEHFDWSEAVRILLSAYQMALSGDRRQPRTRS